jgi:hypothetical protein
VKGGGPLLANAEQKENPCHQKSLFLTDFRRIDPTGWRGAGRFVHKEATMPHIGGLLTLIFIAAAVITSCSGAKAPQENGMFPSLTLRE